MAEIDKLVRQKRELIEKIDEKKLHLFNIDMEIQENTRKLKEYTTAVESRVSLSKQWNMVNAEEFDETCHDELSPTEREHCLCVFEKSKAERIGKINEKISEVEAYIETAREMLPWLLDHNKDNLANRDKLKKAVADLERQLSDINLNIDHTGEDEEFSLYLIEKYYGFKRELIRNMQWSGTQFVTFEVNGIIYCGWFPFSGAVNQLSVNGYTAKHHNEKDVLVEDWYYDKYIRDKPVRIIRYVPSGEDEGEWEDTGTILKNQEEAEKYINNHNSKNQEEQLHYEIMSDFSYAREEAV